MIVVGAGGTLVESLADVQLLLPPFDADDVRSAISRLRSAAVFDGVRGGPPADVDGWAEAAVRLGDAMVAEDCLMESVDANPVMLMTRPGPGGGGAVAVDAVAIVRSQA